MSVRGRPDAQKGRERRAEQNRLRSIVERIADGIVILALDGTIRFANPAAEELFGRAASELKGADLGLPAVAGDTSEVEILRPGGASITAELRVVETEWQGESVRLVSLRDVTDRKRAEQRAAQLQRERVARAEAEASSQAKSEFLATMSHELRTPLNAVLGYSDLLDLGISGSLTGEQRQQIARIRDSARHLLGLVNEVLDLAKVETGRLTVESEAARAAAAVDAALGLVQPVAEARGIVMVNNCRDADIVYQGDEDRVRQVLLNLLNNAVKFTPPGGRVTIQCGVVQQPGPETRIACDAPCVAIRVTDTGIGIPHERLAAIFEPFVQVEGGHTRPNDGSGLGLTISRRLARIMSGDLTVHSMPGEGSTFTLWLPEASSAQREVTRWRSQSPDAAARLEGLADIGERLLRELPLLIDNFVRRLREEASVPGAAQLRSSQLADHVATYVADVASMLVAIEEARGLPSSLVADGAQIQLYVAERHGAHRARLGWRADVIRREWTILREEIERVIRLQAGAVRARAVSEALMMLQRLIEQAEENSLRAAARAAEPADHLQRSS